MASTGFIVLYLFDFLLYCTSHATLLSNSQGGVLSRGWRVLILDSLEGVSQAPQLLPPEHFFLSYALSMTTYHIILSFNFNMPAIAQYIWTCCLFHQMLKDQLNYISRWKDSYSLQSICWIPFIFNQHVSRCIHSKIICFESLSWFHFPITCWDPSKLPVDWSS